MEAILLLILVSLVILYLYIWKCSRVVRLSKRIKNDITCLPLIGHSYLFIGNSEDHMNAFITLGREAVKQGGMTKAWLGFNLYIVIADSEIAHLILNSCLEKDDATRLGKEVLGNGSMTATVPVWRPRRKLTSVIFSTTKLNLYVDCHIRHTCTFIQKLKPLIGRGPVQLWDHLYSSVFDAVLESTVGIHLEVDHPFFQAFDSLCSIFSIRMCQPWLRHDWVWKASPYYWMMKKNRQIIYDVADQVILSKQEAMKQCDKQGNGKEVKSFLEMLIESSKRHGFSDTELKEEIMGLVFAAVDTTSVTMSFLIHELATHTDVQDKVYNEIIQVIGGPEKSISPEHLPELQFTQAVINETLRLYPAAPIIARKIDKDLQIPTSNLTLTKGLGAMINIWAVNRNPKYWGPDAETFKPERFLQREFVHPAQFLTFSFGPRNCIGHKYAMLALKTMLVTTLQQYRFLAASSTHKPLRLKFEILMKDVDKVKVRLEHR